MLFLVGHGGATDHQELRTHQPHAVGATGGTHLGLFGDIDVGTNDHPHAVGGDRLAVREFAHLANATGLLLHSEARLLQLVLGGRDEERALCAVENRNLPRHEKRQRVAQADYRRQSQRSSQNGNVRRSGTGLGGDGRDAITIELHRERRREVVRHENRVCARRHVDGVMIRQVEQHGQHADVHVHEITDFLAQHRCGVTSEMLPPFEQNEIEGFLGAKILTDEGFAAARQFSVVEDGDLHVEDRGLFGAGLLFGARAQQPQAIARAGERVAQTPDLRFDGVIVDEAMLYLGHLPAQEMHRSDDDPRRRGNAAEHRLHQLSPNRDATSAASDSNASSASGPDARNVIVAPCSAASIMTPMMLLPFTSRSSREIVMSLLKRDAAFTISAAGRAWSPCLFTI